MKKVYKKPVLQSENLEFGVFGCYGMEGNGYSMQSSWTGWFSFWGDAFSYFWRRGRKNW